MGIWTNDNFTKMTNLEEFIKVWQKFKQHDKRGMSIIVGFTKMTYFAKLANLAKVSLQCKDLAKKLNETTKEAY